MMSELMIRGRTDNVLCIPVEPKVIRELGMGTHIKKKETESPMSSHTKIVVLRSKELLYTILLVVVVLLTIIILFSLFVPGADSSDDEEAAISTEVAYVPGVYTSTLQLGNTNLEMQVVVDANHINDISIRNLDESVETMYPLMQPTLTELENKVLEAQTVENISYSTETKYTSLMLLNSISQALGKATIVTENTQPSVDEMQ